MTARRIRRAGDRGWMVDCARGEATRLALALRTGPARARLDDAVPADRSLLAVAATSAAMAALHDEIRRVLDADPVGSAPPAARPGAARTTRIPVRYDGIDLAEALDRIGLTRAELIERHTGARHHVAFFGFAPGFAYIEGNPESMRVPRLPSPRPRVAAGVVAIAGTQSVVYPGGTPGGWLQIGTTDTRLWDVEADPPNALNVGDRVQFTAVPE